MIKYTVNVKNNKIVDNIKLISPSMSEIANLTFILQQRIMELIKLDAKKLTLKYPIDKEGNLIKEGEDD